MQKQKQRHQHHHQQQQAPQKPRGSRGALREFSLAQWTDADCRDLFWFSKDEIIAIVDALELPERVAATGVTCTPLEAVCVFLRRMAHRDRLQDMAPLFDRASSVLCNVYLHMVAFVCEKNRMDPNHSDTKRLGRTLREQGPEQSKLKNYPHMLTHGGNKRPRH
ncbi:TPA: hypothetical protein N0F65_011147 [Lagenidium giganteum]|uniref:Uncharacterized protein n=1 Tax=Lagenidium giganteum TaxID=4803 RepID=A0AAV2Z8E8_9STRA|nr:TPA: hypothetical protein N0F65_011147 [Lagenidium giganteum]